MASLSVPAVESRWCCSRVFCENTMLERMGSQGGGAQRTSAAGLRPPPLPVL